jgi:hypothetical protein
MLNFDWKVLGKLSHEWQRMRQEDNIKMDLKEMSCEGRKWMKSTQYPVQWQSLILVVNLWVGLAERYWLVASCVLGDCEGIVFTEVAFSR